MKTTGEYVQCAYRKAWLMFDLDNGHKCNNICDNGKGYLWIFKTKKEAEFLRKFHRENDLPSLSKPVRIEYR